MPQVNEIVKYLDSVYPFSMKEPWDNVGLLAGFPDREVSRCVLALDITQAVVEEAAVLGAELIIAHHPMFFELKSVLSSEPQGRRLITLLQSGISALCMHTNLDAAPEGVNTALARRLGVTEPRPLEVAGTDSQGRPYGLGAYGELAREQDLDAFVQMTREILGCAGLRTVSAGGPVRRLAVCGGSGGDFLYKAARAGCDTLVTADVKHHQFLDARELGVNLIDAGHFNTENVILPQLSRLVSEKYPGICVLVSETCRQIEAYN